MNNRIKICIYFKNREKPVILSDVLNQETTFESILKTFQDLFASESRTVVLEFANDYILLNTKDVETIVISKPTINSLEIMDENAADEGGSETQKDGENIDGDQENLVSNAVEVITDIEDIPNIEEEK